MFLPEFMCVIELHYLVSVWISLSVSESVFVSLCISSFEGRWKYSKHAMNIMWDVGSLKLSPMSSRDPAESSSSMSRPLDGLLRSFTVIQAPVSCGPNSQLLGAGFREKLLAKTCLQVVSSVAEIW